MKKIAIFFIILFSSVGVLAKEFFYDELVFSVGMTMTNITENQKTIQGENVAEAVSASVSTISGHVQYKFSSSLKRSYYANVTFPLLPGTTGSYISAGGGVEFYLSDLSSKFGFYDEGTQIVFTPKLRYFWGAEADIAYVVYHSETATKTDMLLELGILGGGAYVFSDKWTIKGSLAAFKGTGVVSSGMTIRFVVGASFYY